MFPPTPFKPVFALLKSERRAKFLAGQMRPRLLRHSWLGFGLLAKNLPADLTRSWIEPARTDAGVRRDAVRFLRAVKPDELLDVSTRLDRFDGPVSIVWGADDHTFTHEAGKAAAAGVPWREVRAGPEVADVRLARRAGRCSPTRS